LIESRGGGQGLQYYQANRRPKSFERHQMAFKALKPFFGGQRLADISPFLIEKYKRLRKEASRSEVTINRELAFLKNMFTMAIKWGKASENPMKQVRLFREDNGRTRFLAEDEEAHLLACCGPYLRPIVITALHTGFRKSELLCLTWADVDFVRQTLTVRAAYTKNGETRSVPMTAVLTDTLKAIRINAAPTAPVFRTREGQPYRHISTAFGTAMRRAGVMDFTFHDLRHTFASRLVMEGVDLTTVKELMGHKHITMTLRYAHLAPGHKRSAIAVLDRLADKVPSIFTTGGGEAPHRSLQALAK
jgi:integrase